jgi:hypothetical protein
MQVRRSLAIIAALLVVAALYSGYWLGVQVTVARALFLETVPLREDYKCISSGDAACQQALWHFRASVAAVRARQLLASPVPSGVGNELQSYVEWFEQLPQAPQTK